MITRPNTTFEGASHSYGLEGWDDDDVIGISTAAKLGGIDSMWNTASGWGFKLGYEGAAFVASTRPGDNLDMSCAELREAISAEGLAPWSKRDAAADRGNWVHDLLEALANSSEIPDVTAIEHKEVAGHMRSVLGWYVEYRPSFVATEVQVSSVEHGFAGRYDIRCEIDARKLLPLIEGHEAFYAKLIKAKASVGDPALCLVDLKTSKDIYPDTHFPQLAGYELAGVEMGFPRTDCQLVLNSKADGSPAQMAVSWATGEDFVAFVEAYRAIKRMKRRDPEERLRKLREASILWALGNEGPMWSSELAKYSELLRGSDARAIGRICGKLSRRGLLEQLPNKKWERVKS